MPLSTSKYESVGIAVQGLADTPCVDHCRPGQVPHKRLVNVAVDGDRLTEGQNTSIQVPHRLRLQAAQRHALAGAQACTSATGGSVTTRGRAPSHAIRSSPKASRVNVVISRTASHSDRGAGKLSRNFFQSFRSRNPRPPSYRRRQSSPDRERDPLSPRDSTRRSQDRLHAGLDRVKSRANPQAQLRKLRGWLSSHHGSASR